MILWLKNIDILANQDDFAPKQRENLKGLHSFSLNNWEPTLICHLSKDIA